MRLFSPRPAPQYMLRQGKSAVQALHEVEILTTDYAGDETLAQQSTSGPMTVHTIVRGRLHVRTGSIGEWVVDPLCLFFFFL